VRILTNRRVFVNKIEHLPNVNWDGCEGVIIYYRNSPGKPTKNAPKTFERLAREYLKSKGIDVIDFVNDDQKSGHYGSQHLQELRSQFPHSPVLVVEPLRLTRADDVLQAYLAMGPVYSWIDPKASRSTIQRELTKLGLIDAKRSGPPRKTVSPRDFHRIYQGRRYGKPWRAIANGIEASLNTARRVFDELPRTSQKR